MVSRHGKPRGESWKAWAREREETVQARTVGIIDWSGWVVADKAQTYWPRLEGLAPWFLRNPNCQDTYELLSSVRLRDHWSAMDKIGLRISQRNPCLPPPRRILFLLSLYALLSGAADAQEKSFLWQVRSNKSNIYILGSIHFWKKDDYPLKNAIEKAFAGSQKLVFEIDLKNTDAATVQRVTLEKGVDRDGATLQQNISLETYSLAEKRAKELGIDIRALSPLKPWLVALTLTTLKLQKLGFSPNSGVDRYLAQRAIESGKATAGLETAAFQIGLLDQLSKPDQEAMLRQALTEMDLLDKSLGRIVHSWASGDVQSLEETLLSGMRGYPEVHQKIIVDRNQRWLPQIEKMLEESETTLVVVGAAHLVGKQGVIELLKARGYTVEQL